MSAGPCWSSACPLRLMQSCCISTILAVTLSLLLLTRRQCLCPSGCWNKKILCEVSTSNSCRRQTCRHRLNPRMRACMRLCTLLHTSDFSKPWSRNPKPNNRTPKPETSTCRFRRSQLRFCSGMSTAQRCCSSTMHRQMLATQLQQQARASMPMLCVHWRRRLPPAIPKWCPQP